MGRRLFVGGLAWATDDEGLGRAFETFGRIEDVKVIMDRDTGRSKGFGFVTFANEVDAERALQRMNGTELDGRRIRVDPAQERDRSGGGNPRPWRGDAPPVEARRPSGDRPDRDAQGGQRPAQRPPTPGGYGRK